MQSDSLGLLRLMQLADSALPIGVTAHSFGLETLAAEGTLAVGQLGSFLRDYLSEVGTLESAFCRAAYRLAGVSERNTFAEGWLDLNSRLTAFKPARESRAASATLGRRFLQLAFGLGGWPLLETALQVAKQDRTEIHYSAAFGLTAGLLEVEEETAVLAYLQQTLMGLVSACQRLLPLGQQQASRLLWELKPALIDTATQTRTLELDQLSCFTPMLDLAAMRHPALPTRLFIS